MEYPVDAAVNRGRLCPRGNSAGLVVDHPRRLAHPLKDGREIDWNGAVAEMKSGLAAARPEETAVVYSRGMTEDELGLIRGFAALLGTRSLVCGYSDPDNCFQYRLSGVKSAAPGDVKGAKTTLLVGDVFGTSPVAAGPIVEARYQDRKNRLVVIDSIKTRQAGFAHLFLQVKPGTEVFSLAAIAAVMSRTEGVDVGKCSELTGLAEKQFAEVAAILKNGPVFVGCAMHPGRVSQPIEHSLASQLVAARAGGTFTGFGEAQVPFGTMSFGALRHAVAQDQVKSVFWFGGLHPYSYPELTPEMSRLQFRCATSIFWPGAALPGLVLPVASEFEKESAGSSYWGAVARRPVAARYSGSKSVAWILSQQGEVVPEKPAALAPVSETEVLKRVSAALSAFRVPELGLLLVGEKRASGVGGFYDAEAELRVSVDDARVLDLHDGDRAVVETVSGQAEFDVKLTRAVPKGVLAVGTNVHCNRALFPLAGDEVPVIPPVAARLTRSTVVSSPVAERQARFS
jgi:anaerobic selenocysteine-containing dehydrogenase